MRQPSLPSITLITLATFWTISSSILIASNANPPGSDSNNAPSTQSVAPQTSNSQANEPQAGDPLAGDQPVQHRQRFSSEQRERFQEAMRQRGGLGFRGPGSGGLRRDGSGGPSRPEGRDISNAPVTNEEWASISAFMSENSPVRLKLYERVVEKLGENSAPAHAMRRRFSRVHRQLIETQKRAPDLYEFAERQYLLEDELLGISDQIRERGTDPAAELQARLDGVLSELIQNNLAERQRRLENWRKLLEQEEQRLSRDRERPEELKQRVSARFNEEFFPIIRMLPALLGREEPKTDTPTDTPTDTRPPTNGSGDSNPPK